MAFSGSVDAEEAGFPSDWPRVSVEIWDQKYRLKQPDGTPVDRTWRDTVHRVASAAAKVEKAKVRSRHLAAFEDAIADFAFLPAGRILAGAGTGRKVTLFNCFVMGAIGDNLPSIFENVKEAALTMQQGGGIGHDFSTLRPKGALVKSIGADASGPVTFMDVWDAMCRTIMSAGSRRGAMMATLRCDHPDIEAFVDAKRDSARLRNFNLSVLATDPFMRAVREDDGWDLVFDGKVYRRIRARDLWDRIMRATYDVAEPGIIFIDRVNDLNNLAYCESISATNPCGEQPLPPYGACLLGSINLARLVEGAFTVSCRFDETRLDSLVRTAVRFLDNIVDVSNYPLKAQQAEAKAKRRIGLGVTGLADALIQLGVRYGSPEALVLTDRWLSKLKIAAYDASAELAEEKGAFELCDVDALLKRPALIALPSEVRSQIARHGLRNGLLTSIAPTGTISLLAGNVSSGIEPVFDLSYDRRVLRHDGSARTERVEDYAFALHRRVAGRDSRLPSAFVTSSGLTPRQHIEMQSAAQRHIDSAISKTINCPVDIPFGAFKDVYLDAHALGLKGVTTYRPNDVTGAVLTSSSGDASTADGEERHDAGVGRKVAARTERDGVVYMAEPLARQPVLAGFTYKLKWPGSEHAMYITINDIEVEGRRRPFEIFINSKNLDHYSWTLALTRMISAVFRRGGDISFVVEELKAVFDPQGGRWMDGRYVPSLLAAIGDVIEAHLVRIGAWLPAEGDGPEARRPNKAIEIVAAGTTEMEPEPRSRGASQLVFEPREAGVRGRACPRCGASTFLRQEGCWVCRTCGHSSCG